ncbi:hypothetical protein BJV74DRAFT_888266 [Russula compacta]|nr:hypothetical protein BJV74DRAFT_888266 [Russula compacta]
MPINARYLLSLAFLHLSTLIAAAAPIDGPDATGLLSRKRDTDTVRVIERNTPLPIGSLGRYYRHQSRKHVPIRGASSHTYPRHGTTVSPPDSAASLTRVNKKRAPDGAPPEQEYSDDEQEYPEPGHWHFHGYHAPRPPHHRPSSSYEYPRPAHEYAYDFYDEHPRPLHDEYRPPHDEYYRPSHGDYPRPPHDGYPRPPYDEYYEDVRPHDDYPHPPYDPMHPPSSEYDHHYPPPNDHSDEDQSGEDANADKDDTHKQKQVDIPQPSSVDLATVQLPPREEIAVSATRRGVSLPDKMDVAKVSTREDESQVSGTPLGVHSSLSTSRGGASVTRLGNRKEAYLTESDLEAGNFDARRRRRGCPIDTI